MQLNTNLMNSTDTELLAVLLGNRKTAETLLRNAKCSLFALLHQTPQDNTDLFCSEVKRTYSGDPVSKLQAARELAARAIAEELQHRDALTSPAAVRALLQHRLAGLPHEVFAVLLLDAQNRVIAMEELFRGTLTQTSVYPREVVKTALKANAASVIFAHNHPSGVAEPSRADELLTQSLKQALSLVDVKTLDHFIVAGTKTLSFAERGLL
jgi:DNA repair protein RadC